MAFSIIQKAKNKNVVFFLFIILIAAFFRLWDLDAIPPGLYPDVAMNGTNAIHAIQDQDYKVFYQENNGREGLFMNLIAFSFQIFGVSLWSLRLIGSLIGILTVVGIYFLTKEILNRTTIQENIKNNVALAATLFTAVSFWHVNFSRIGFRAIMVPFVMVWCFYFLLKWRNMTISKSEFKSSYRIFLMVLAGLFFGLGFHTYIAFRFAPFVVIIFALSHLAYLIINKNYKLITQWFIGYIVFNLAAIIVMFPLLIYFYNNPGDFMGRASQVSIFEQPNLLLSLGESLIKTVGMFNIYGDPNWRHNYSGSPLLYWPIGIFFAIGAVVLIGQVIERLRRNTKSSQYSLDILDSILLLSWMVIILAPSYITAEGLPHALRSIGAIPPTMVLAGIGGWWLYEKIRQSEFRIGKREFNRILPATACLIMVLITFHEFKKYFYDWGRNPEARGAFTQNLVDVGNFIKTLPKDNDVYVIVNEGGISVEGVPVSAQTVKFIYEIGGQAQAKPRIQYVIPEDLEKIEVSNSRPSILVPEHYDEKIFDELQAKFQSGIIEKRDTVTYFIIN